MGVATKRTLGVRAIACAGLLALSACGEKAPEAQPAAQPPQPAAQAARPVPPKLTKAQLERGQTLYEKHCASCHGTEGRGDGPAAYLLYPKPRDFTMPRYRLLSNYSMTPSAEDLFHTISRGMPGSAMPPWEHLAAGDRWALVATVQRLQREGTVKDLLQGAQASGESMTREEAEEEATELLALGEPVTLPPEPPVTAESIARGREIYMQSCAPCHDADGRGRNKRDLKDSRGYPIFARDFTRGIFKGGATSEQLAYRILAGMPGTPMPGYASTLKDHPEDLWALVHAVQAFVPPGAEERNLQRKRTIRAARVVGPLDTDPKNALWEKAEPVYVASMPLWWRDERVEGVTVRALHDGRRLALRLTWIDPTEDRTALRHEDFADGAAIQLSAAEDPPFFAMGSKEALVTIWHWKAQWEADQPRYQDVEDAYPRTVVDRYPGHGSETFRTAAAAKNLMAVAERGTAVENLAAGGFGTLTSHGPGGQTVKGASVFDRSVWNVVFLRDLAAGEGDLSFSPGGTLSVAFAVWDGGGGDRNGQKSVTIWHSLQLEK